MTESTYPQFTISGADKDLTRICKEKLQALYGTNPPVSIVERLNDEFSRMTGTNYSSVYMLLHYLAAHLRNAGGRIGIRGTLSSTLTSFLLGISDINPLPAHYRCPCCGYPEFASADSGYDLPAKACPHCGSALCGDGHNIPYETCLGIDPVEQIETVEINVSASAWKKAVCFLVDFLGAERIARADEWNNPVCFMLLPDGMHFEDVTPITELTPSVCGVHKRTVLPGYDLVPALLRVILLPHCNYDVISQLHQLTGTKPEDIDYSDPSVYQLFQNSDTCGISGFSTDCSKEILQTRKDISFSDLIRVNAMACGSGVWENNGEKLLEHDSFRELITSRDDIFLALRKYGLDPQIAYDVMEIVRKGRFCADTDQNRKMAQKLLRKGVPEWYVESMRKIHYLFPKAHAAHHTKTAVVLAWFKTYFPNEFYNVILHFWEAEELLHCNDKELSQKLESFEKQKHYKEPAQEVIELLLEVRHRNVPIDLSILYRAARPIIIK